MAKITTHEIFRLIRDSGSVRHSDLNVLLMLAIRADVTKGFSCYPSRPLLGRDCGLDLSILRRSTKRLEAAGLISIQKRFNGSDLFRINVRLLQQLAATNNIEKADPPSLFEDPIEDDVDPHQANTSATSAPEASNSSLAAPKRSTASPVVTALLSLPRIGSNLTPSAADSMAASLRKTHSEQDILSALDIIGHDQDRLEIISEANNPVGYLRTCIDSELDGSTEPEPIKLGHRSTFSDAEVRGWVRETYNCEGDILQFDIGILGAKDQRKLEYQLKGLCFINMEFKFPEPGILWIAKQKGDIDRYIRYEGESREIETEHINA